MQIYIEIEKQWGFFYYLPAIVWSSLCNNDLFAVSISELGWSNTCLHHCKGLEDFWIGVGNLFGDVYNLKWNVNKEFPRLNKWFILKTKENN